MTTNLAHSIPTKPKYSYRVTWSTEANEWIAGCPEWRFLGGSGATPAAAIADLDTVIAASIDIFKAESWELPQPIYYEDDDGDN